jgi:hypothetical protein
MMCKKFQSFKVTKSQGTQFVVVNIQGFNAPTQRKTPLKPCDFEPLIITVQDY